MADSITPKERSAQMAKVRSTGNRSTEMKVAAALKEAGIKGWKKHPESIAGRPDFYFPKARLAVFVDGCFWHACPKCGRRLPSSNAEYWNPKIDSNRRRDNRTRRQLRALGFHVVRIWEHDLRRKAWLRRLARMVEKYGRV